MNSLVEERIKYYESIGLKCEPWSEINKRYKIYFTPGRNTIYLTNNELNGSHYYIENNKITRIAPNINIFGIKIKIVP